MLENRGISASQMMEIGLKIGTVRDGNTVRFTSGSDSPKIELIICQIITLAIKLLIAK